MQNGCECKDNIYDTNGYMSSRCDTSYNVFNFLFIQSLDLALRFTFCPTAFLKTFNASATVIIGGFSHVTSSLIGSMLNGIFCPTAFLKYSNASATVIHSYHYSVNICSQELK